MRTCVLVNTHDEGVTRGSCGNVARMFNLFKVIRAITCVWDNGPLICARITNVLVMLLMDLLLSAPSSIGLITAGIQLFSSAADPLADL